MSAILRTLLLASSVTVWAAGEAAAAEYQCRKLDSSLRIAIEVEKEGHTLPCEVVVEDDRGERALLYSAQYDREYCPSRLDKTRTELEQDGWACQKTSDRNIVNDESAQPAPPREQSQAQSENPAGSDGGAPEAGSGRIVTSTHQCRQGGKLRSINVEVENPASGRPCELIYWPDGDQTKAGQLLWRAEHDATFCPRRLETIVDKWIGEGWQCDVGELQTAAVETSPTPEAKPEAPRDQVSLLTTDRAEDGDTPATLADAALEAVVTADAKRIGEWMEVEPAIEIAARGDLNDDGSDDAVVFLAYQSDQAAYRQYLMSYLVEDDGYELASVKLLIDVNPPPAQARVEQIDKGVIWLTLPDKDGSALAQTGYRLRDQQLVEVDSKSPADTGE